MYRESARNIDDGVPPRYAALRDASSDGDEAISEQGLGTKISRIFAEIGVDFSDFEIPEFTGNECVPVSFDE